MAESYFNHLAHEEVSQAMVKREREKSRRLPPISEDDSNSKKIKLENKQPLYNDFSKRMMVRIYSKILVNGDHLMANN